jgi:hypothetical protein
MNWLTLIVLVALAVWWFKPLREFLIQRTNRTVKVLLVVFPALFLVRLGYGIYKGEQDDWFVVALTVSGLLLLWAALVALGNWLERRRPTRARAPDLATLSRIPGVPRLPQVPVASPEVRRAAQAAAQAAAQVDWNDVAGSVGRASGRLAARLRKSYRSTAGADEKRSAPRQG